MQATIDRTESLSTREVADAVGISYRQVDYWIRQGVIAPRWVVCNPGGPSTPYPGTAALGPGSGSRRRWHPDQVRLVRVIAALRSYGCSVEDAGHAAAELALLSPDAWHGHHIYDGRYVLDLDALA